MIEPRHARIRSDTVGTRQHATDSSSPTIACRRSAYPRMVRYGEGWLVVEDPELCASAMLPADVVDEVVDAQPDGDLTDSPTESGLLSDCVNITIESRGNVDSRTILRWTLDTFSILGSHLAIPRACTCNLALPRISASRVAAVVENILLRPVLTPSRGLATWKFRCGHCPVSSGRSYLYIH